MVLQRKSLNGRVLTYNVGIMKRISLPTFNRLKKEQKRILFVGEGGSGTLTPHQAYYALRGGLFSTIFEVLNEETGESYSFIGVNPVATFQSLNRKTTIAHRNKQLVWRGAPYTLLRKFIQKYAPITSKALPYKWNSLFGHCAYDAVRLKTKLPDRHPNAHGIPDLHFHFFETVVLFDHRKKKLFIALNIDPEEIDYQEACDKLTQVQLKIAQPFVEASSTEKKKQMVVKEEMSDREYMGKVKEAQKHLAKGEITQIVLSRTFSTLFKGDPFLLYCTLQQINPSPYSYLFEGKNYSMVGESPEKLVSVQKGIVETVPVGGTHPRDPEKGDAAVAKMLLNNPKEVGEHMLKMQVGYDDIVKVSKRGTVKIVELKGTRVFSHVIHIVTRIKGTLRQDRDCFDALQSILPAATLSGSPKKRAMELIDLFENSRRGIYGGAICLVDPKLNLESCIPIRSIFIKEGIAYVRAGAGIVAASDPQYEANETRHKSAAALKALQVKACT